MSGFIPVCIVLMMKSSYISGDMYVRLHHRVLEGL